MAISSGFWASFGDGLTAPVALFSAPSSYDAYAAVLQPAQCFSVVGAFLTQALPQIPDDKPAVADRTA
jgi:hypothetical protein